MIILFDLDDTLITHGAAMDAAVNSIHDSCGTSLPLNEFREAWHAAHRRHYPRFLSGELAHAAMARARIREVVDERLADSEADALFDRYLELYQAGWKLFPDVLPCLDRLAGTRLGVITNGPSVEQRRKLTTTGMAPRFEHVIISEEYGRAKPDPEIFWHACQAFGVPTEEALYVGDNLALDARAARAAGLRGVWLDRRGEATPEHEGPVVRSLAEVGAC